MRKQSTGCFRLSLFLAGLLAGSGCVPTSPGGGGDGGGGGSGDDGMPMSNMPMLTIRWSLEDCAIQGMTCGFQTTCGDAAATKITFNAVNPATKKGVMTKVDCPKDSKSAYVPITLPDDTGPFEISGLLDNLAMSASRHVCAVGPKDNITVTLYYKGCDDARCTACP